jgi:hypothetical protein
MASPRRPPPVRSSTRAAASGPAGDSGTPLVKKLGIKPGDVVALYGAPDHDVALLGELPAGVTIRDGGTGQAPFAHFFTASRAALQKALPKLAKVVSSDGMLWISWPKKSSSLAGDLDENGVRELVLPSGLVDVKVCAVDADWSGHKFVWRKELRGG